MRDFIFVEFIFTLEEIENSLKLIKELGDDFILISEHNILCDYTKSPFSSVCTSVTGKINSTTATVLKLSNPFLADRMRVSYITDELKDRYRNR